MANFDEKPLDVKDPNHAGFCAMYLFAVVGFGVGVIVGGFYLWL